MPSGYPSRLLLPKLASFNNIRYRRLLCAATLGAPKQPNTRKWKTPYAARNLTERFFRRSVFQSSVPKPRDTIRDIHKHKSISIH